MAVGDGGTGVDDGGTVGCPGVGVGPVNDVCTTHGALQFCPVGFVPKCILPILGFGPALRHHILLDQPFPLCK